MPSARDIRRRIRGVRNIKQVTRAMNMIAAARLRRAQAKAEAARPYAQRLTEILTDVAAAGGARHPLLERREVRRVGLVIITSDRGLAGAFNANILREAGHFVAQQRVPVGIITVGRKGRDFLRGRGVTVDEHFPQPSRDVRLEEVGAIRKRIIGDFLAGRYDQIWLAYAQFISVLKSAPVVVPLLPLEPPTEAAGAPRQKAAYQFEPAGDALLETLLPQYVEVVIYRALVESLASEQAARMVAMKAATDSASEMIENLTREYNRMRQDAITKQLLEVVSGADALAKAEQETA